MCGIEGHTEEEEQPKMTKEEHEAMMQAHLDISEEPKMKLITNINAVILAAVAIFFCGFFY